MKRGLCLLLLNVLLLPASGCAPTGSADRQPARATTAMATIIPAIDLAADFTLATLDGGSFTLSALRGRWVLINFWATWCIPCRDEMPYLSELAHTEGDTLTVLAINMREGPETVAAFVAELGIDLPILLNPDDATLLAYGVRGLPMSFLVAPDGALVKRIPGIVQPDDLLVVGTRWPSCTPCIMAGRIAVKKKTRMRRRIAWCKSTKRCLRRLPIRRL